MKMLIYNQDERYTASQCLKHPYFKEYREKDKKLMGQATAGPGGFGKSISGTMHYIDNISQNSKPHSDNMSDAGSVVDSSFHNRSFHSKKPHGMKKFDKKKVLPNNKKFPELKLIINGEGRASNQTFSSEDEYANM
mmetsp:Transcript_34127/g.33303  ORF Transcript_34127/g.33303 Transcript_34127/m.33303 type:complete len:136 (-) Transcript_34127:321-728(-)